MTACVIKSICSVPITRGLSLRVIPNFSEAILDTVSPSRCVWSKDTFVITETSGYTTLVESHLPPRPTSRTAISIFSSEKYLKASKVDASK